jgi:transcriptional regulator with XRE-family HTH domain
VANTLPAVRKAFGQRLRSLRKQRGYSQEVLAERADLHFTYVSSVERGARNISLVNIVRLARALKVSPASLFQDIS